MVKKKSSDVKPRKNSDTIKSNYDSPNHTIKRSVMRCLTRKRPTKVHKHKAKNAPSSSNKHKQQEKTISTFEEECSRKINFSTLGGSISKNEKKKSSRTEPR